jgi:hypothetical protein
MHRLPEIMAELLDEPGLHFDAPSATDGDVDLVGHDETGDCDNETLRGHRVDLRKQASADVQSVDMEVVQSISGRR